MRITSLCFLTLAAVIAIATLTYSAPVIVSNPDPPPEGRVGEFYTVTFTVNTTYTPDRWESVPTNPVPGLSWSNMQNTKSVTLRGTPTQAGTYSFTLRVYRGEKKVAERIFTIKIRSVVVVIVSNPDPPPEGRVGEPYTVTFTVNTTYTPDRWESNPVDPVPGLSWSNMQNTKSVTLRGTPTQAGTYSFNLKAYYKGSVLAQKSFTIRIQAQPVTQFDVYKIQVLPSVLMLNRLSPMSIYIRDHVLFVFWTNHPDPVHITWTGINGLPGTSFRVMEVSRFLRYIEREYPQLTAAQDLRPIAMLDPNAPILVMEGNVTQFGRFSVRVQAEDSRGNRRTGEWSIDVHGPEVRVEISFNTTRILWNTTAYMFPPPQPLRDTYRYDLRKNFTITLRISFRAYIGTANCTVRIEAPSGLSPHRQGVYTESWSYVTESNTSRLNTKEFRENIELRIVPRQVSAPYPGTEYKIRVSASVRWTGPSGGEMYSSDEAELSVIVFHYIPEISITEFQPVSQLPNPYHYLVWWGDVFREEKNLLVLGKQATFRFNYTLNFQYPIDVLVRVTLPKSDWEWRPSSVRLPSRRPPVYFLRIDEAPPSGIDPGNCAWYGETRDDYIIYDWYLLDPSRSPQIVYILYPKFQNLENFWFPKPKRTPAQAKFELVCVGDLCRGDENLLPLPFRQNVTRLTFPEATFIRNFNSPVTRIGGLKIGYFIMDPDWFIQNSIRITDIRDRFPWAVERYLEGLFPIDVKEVRYLGNVSRPYVTGLST
ncbi:MAG: Ig domain-containing protein, partial [Thermofilaceae archaeon]